jgi:hypothetical protein
MLDVVFAGMALAFFVASWGFVLLCGWLQGGSLPPQEGNR